RVAEGVRGALSRAGRLVQARRRLASEEAPLDEAVHGADDQRDDEEHERSPFHGNDQTSSSSSAGTRAGSGSPHDLTVTFVTSSPGRLRERFETPCVESTQG